MTDGLERSTITLGELRDYVNKLVEAGLALDTPVFSEGCDCYGDVELLEAYRDDVSAHSRYRKAGYLPGKGVYFMRSPSERTCLVCDDWESNKPCKKAADGEHAFDAPAWSSVLPSTNSV